MINSLSMLLKRRVLNRGIFLLVAYFISMVSFAEPVDPAVKTIAPKFSLAVQQNFYIFADSADEKLAWVLPRYGTIASNHLADPEFSIGIHTPQEEFFAGKELVSFNGIFDVSSNPSSLQMLTREAKQLGYRIESVIAEKANTTFLASGFEVANGRIQTTCIYETQFTIEGIVEVPVCSAVNKYGETVLLDFLYKFDAGIPAGGTKVMTRLPFSATTLPGWDDSLRSLMSFGGSWDHLLQAAIQWEIKTTDQQNFGTITVRWRNLYVALRQYFSNCRWSCNETELNNLLTNMVLNPSAWGLDLKLQNTVISDPKTFQLVFETIRDKIAPEFYVEFIDEIAPNPSLYQNIASRGKASASSTFCSGGPAPSEHCYNAARANDGNISTLLGGTASWSNDLYARLPQWWQVEWSGAMDIRNVTVYTSEGFITKDFDIQVLDKNSQTWVTLASVTNNQKLVSKVAVSAKEIKQLRVVGKSGPSHQPQYVRFNEVVIDGRPSMTAEPPKQQRFYSLRGNYRKLIQSPVETLQLIQKGNISPRNETTLLYLQCMKGGFGAPATWFYDDASCAPTYTVNVAPLGSATASTTYCSGVNPSTNCYDPVRVNDGNISTALGGYTSWTNKDIKTMPKWWQLSFTNPMAVKNATVYTSESYPVKDFDLEYWDMTAQVWRNLGSVRGNTGLQMFMEFAPVTSNKFRVVGLSGPIQQTQYVRLNEVLLEGYPVK